VRIHITGIVQGVGFRPFIYNLALRHNLKGFCRNDSEGVTIEVEGGEGIEGFIQDIKTNAPPLSRIDSLSSEALPTDSGMDSAMDSAMDSGGFKILESSKEQGKFALVSPDIAICDECAEELFDPGNRRFGYPFTNCTNCGPRYSIILDIPYDRPNTTMSKFKMCAPCEEEYHDPENRRFHAQPNACQRCGPRVWLVKAGGGGEEKVAQGGEAIEKVKGLLREGAIIAIKGLGGFHIACDAANDGSVKRLRERKRKSNKPFAVMAPSIERVREFCAVSIDEEKLLSGSIRPIVILEKNPLDSKNPISEHVSPPTLTLGVMLPYTPLHHLVCQGFTALVMTSGNISEEPIVVSNEEALEKLSGIADFFLLHDRDIYMRVDDSIARFKKNDGKLLVLRRARGYAPQVLDTGEPTEEILACGGEKKNTFALTKSHYSILSQHMGDLVNYDAFEFFRETLKNLKNTFRAVPSIVAHDMHPDYMSTSFAREYKKEANIRDEYLIAVQHHHAHVVSAMAEHGISGHVIGVAMDGTGYGSDGCVWGGEFIISERRYFLRRAHLKYVPMPGGDMAAKEPWRMAASHLYSAFGGDMSEAAPDFIERIGMDKIQLIVRMIKDKINSPLTSSAGRLFDAVSSLLNITDISTFEAEAAIRLEKEAASTAGVSAPSFLTAPYPFEIKEKGLIMEVDTAPLIKAIVDDMKTGVATARISAVFHDTMAAITVEVAKRLREESGLGTVILSGGVFQNFYLLTKTVERLKEDGFAVFHNEKIPINDGGISLGQAVSAWETAKVMKALGY